MTIPLTFHTDTIEQQGSKQPLAAGKGQQISCRVMPAIFTSTI